MSELLAPAGSMEALKAAISNGCDAIYLGMQRFGARAYSANFDVESLKEAITYAHLRNVKIYVTMNIIVFEEELEDMKQQLHLLNELKVDGVIVSDMATFQYIVDNFEDMEAHCSTQMGIDDLEGTLLWKEKGAKRVVLSREVPIEKVKEIRRIANIPLEIFVHGALCVSYSGNCLMSGLTGYRSGNRGRCVGSCRKLYELVDTTNNTSLGNSYLLSTKDLNTIEHIEDLKAVDSLKVEGRMKEPAYVANVISKYRKALDGKLTKQDLEDLKKTFNRTYTKGYVFHEDKKDITNITKPNNYGYEVGKITNFYKGMYEVTLQKPLHQNDMIRIDNENEDINLSLVKLYDRNGNLINKADKVAYFKAKEKCAIGDKVYITKDYLYYKELETMLEKEYRKFPLHLRVYAYPQAKLVIMAEGLNQEYVYESEDILEEAKQNPTNKEQIVKQLSKLNDTIFTLQDVEFEECNAFIPVKMLNQARRDIVENLYNLKCAAQQNRIKTPSDKKKVAYPLTAPYLTAQVTTQEQYDACVASGIETIYYDNIIRRNQNEYTDKDGELLIGGYGGLYQYRNRNPFVTDYSFNVVNSSSVYQLHELGAKRVTLSYELNKSQIQNIVDNYYKQNDGYPSLEMIIYGKAPLLFTKYCPLKKMNQCGECKKNTYVLKDGNDTFPILSHNDCTTTILNGRNINLLDELPTIKGIQSFRLYFTTETKEEVQEIISLSQQKLQGTLVESVFNQKTDTRGYFNKEIM